MSVQQARPDVTSTATRLDITTDPQRAFTVLVVNRGTADVAVGGVDVTTATGLRLSPGQDLAADLASGDGGLWAVAASGTHPCDVLQVGR